MDLDNSEVECLFIDILFPKTKPFLVGVCYRPPDQNNFIDKFKEVIEKISPGTEAYILGDFNLCFKRDIGLTKSYKRLLNLFSLDQIIKNATRITATTSSIIDHILTNSSDKVSKCGTLNYSFSDHQVIFCIRGSCKSFSPPVTKCLRSFKNYTKALFCDELRRVSWLPVFSAPNADVALDAFNSILLAAVNKIAPLRTVRIKKDSEPWMTAEILDGIKKRESFFQGKKEQR